MRDRKKMSFKCVQRAVVLLFCFWEVFTARRSVSFFREGGTGVYHLLISGDMQPYYFLSMSVYQHLKKTLSCVQACISAAYFPKFHFCEFVRAELNKTSLFN